MGFLQQFSLTSPLNKATQSPKSLLKAFKIFWGDLTIPLKIPSEHIPSESNTSNQKTPFIKPQWHAEAASVCPAWNLGRTGSAAGCFQWLSLVKGDWMKPRKDLSNMFSTGGIYIYIIHTQMGMDQNLLIMWYKGWPSTLRFTGGTGFWPTSLYIYIRIHIHIFENYAWLLGLSHGFARFLQSTGANSW